MIIIIIAITLLANLADLMLKLSACDAGSSLDDLMAIFSSPWIWPGTALGVCAGVAWIYVLGRFHISHAYPVFVGFGFLNITLIAWLFFHEEITWQRCGGILLILAGIIIVHLESRTRPAQPASSTGKPGRRQLT